MLKRQGIVKTSVLPRGSGYGSIGQSLWGVAKWFKAPDFESGTRRFESYRPSLQVEMFLIRDEGV